MAKQTCRMDQKETGGHALIDRHKAENLFAPPLRRHLQISHAGGKSHGMLDTSETKYLVYFADTMY